MTERGSAPAFAPIAIVGRGCVVPGANSPAALWDLVVSGRSALRAATHADFAVHPARKAALGDEIASTAAGLIDGFETSFLADGFGVDAARLTRLDVGIRWLLHAARQALGEARLSFEADSAARRRRGAIIGNLSYPSRGLSRFALATWGAIAPDSEPLEAGLRGVSALPVRVLADAVGFGEAFALDAACASALYAIKYACDRLHDGDADVMLAGGLNAADVLCLHTGFTALTALSRSGRSRPFHPEADGLVPGQGAVLFVLKRLEDVAPDQPVYGIIRGVGLSNDGQSAGPLVPSFDGQLRAMHAAYAESGLSPREIDFVECHATGTLTGDAVELESLRALFGEEGAPPIGSLKGNLGHLLTAAGGAGLLKVLLAMQAFTLPPAAKASEVGRPDARRGSLEVLREARPWLARNGTRRAAVSAFGFGGNNAHLIVEQPEPGRAARPAPARTSLARTSQATAQSAGEQGGARGASPAPRIAIVALSVVAGQGAASTEAFLARVAGAASTSDFACHQIAFDAASLGLPPGDLKRALPQHLLFVQAALALDARVVAGLRGHRTSLYAGMQCDAEAARFALRWRCMTPPALPGSARLTAADVVGCMPNILANRLGRLWNFQGPSASISADEHSGLVGLSLAARALRAGEISAALVGAVDLSVEPVHQAALAARGGEPARCGDAAVLLVLKRVDDALRDADPLLGILALDDEAVASASLDVDSLVVAQKFGCAQAAHGLLTLAVGVAELERAASVTVRVRDTAGTIKELRLLAADKRAPLAAPPHADPSGEARRALHLVSPAHWESPRAELARLCAASAVAGVANASFDAEWMAPAPAPSPEPLELSEALRPRPAAQVRPTLGPSGSRPSLQTELASLHSDFLRRQADAQREFLRLVSLAIASEPASRPESPPSPPIAQAALPRVVSSTQSPTAAPHAELVPLPPSGPTFDRAGLEIHASGAISSIFGPLFTPQDQYARQCRMPEPPLLLADRVTGLAGEPGGMGKGTIWTETDVLPDAWYLHEGRVPAAIMVEAGQADLMLISWLGADLLNRGERVYRLLGCELVCHGALAEPGDTLRYQIQVEGHARQGDIRLFFFRYDCRVGDQVRLSVRNGQAGFFSDEELRQSGGILWDPRVDEPTPSGRVDAARVRSQRRSLSAADVRALIEGRLDECLGPAFARARSHVRTPSIQGGRMQLLDEVVSFEPGGGPWGRGYLRATLDLRPDHWFFDGHFKGDPCMPGTLMFEGCLQAMAIYLIAQGFTLDKDAWRFEPVPDCVYRLQCRGQATPSSRQVTYEVFVDELIDGPRPTLYADILGSVDGLKAFYCRRMALGLVPGWPLERGRLSVPDRVLNPSRDARAASVDGFVFDQAALDACAWGKPSKAFGPMVARFDAGTRLPRLPGPPYHFMSRILAVRGAMGAMEVGSEVVSEYDVPRDAWYFADNGARVAPLSVLMEIALQPCGWLACYVGTPLSRPEELRFRNLDGTAQVSGELLPDAGTVTVKVELTRLASAGAMVIVAFRGDVARRGERVCTFETVFGFFPEQALRDQPGLPLESASSAAFSECAPEAAFSVDDLAPLLYGEGARLPRGRLRMLDRVTGLWREGGRHGLGRIRAERDVSADDWYFKAHFFQDPVQPGSLGMEAMAQALQVFLLLTVSDETRKTHRFEAIAKSPEPQVWKYRGQVLPEDPRITVALDISARGVDAHGPFVWAEGSLWVGDKRIYETPRLGMRLVPREPVESSLEVFDGASVVPAWRRKAGTGAWLGEDLMQAMLSRFVRRVQLRDPLALRPWVSRGAVFVANHQVGCESMLAAFVLGALFDGACLIPAKADHARGWIGRLLEIMKRTQPGHAFDLLRFVDRADPSSLLDFVAEARRALASGRPIFVHVEGTRALSARAAVQKLSSVFLDLAVDAEVPVIPFRFVGGLPREPARSRLEFPVGYGAQDYIVGHPILPAELRTLPLHERTARVLTALNALGGDAVGEAPSAPDEALAAAVQQRMSAGASEISAVWIEILLRARPLSLEGQQLQRWLADGVRPTRASALVDDVYRFLGT